MNINKLLTSALFALLLIGNSAIAGEEAPRDEYSIGLVWDADILISKQQETRVNLLMDESDKDESFDLESLFPEFEH